MVWPIKRESNIPFGFDKHLGEIKTTGLIDYEVNTNFMFYLVVSNSLTDSWSSKCMIQLDVSVTDLKDNKLEFLPTTTIVSVKGSVVFQSDSGLVFIGETLDRVEADLSTTINASYVVGDGVEENLPERTVVTQIKAHDPI